MFSGATSGLGAGQPVPFPTEPSCRPGKIFEHGRVYIRNMGQFKLKELVSNNSKPSTGHL